MDVIALIGRIAFTLCFILGGIGHLTATEAMSGFAATKRVPRPTLAVQVSGIWIIVGSVLLVLGIWPDLGALMLMVFVLGTAVLMHDFWKEPDPQAKQMEQIQFAKDLSLAGGALAIFALYAMDPHPGLLLVGPLF
jgi:putative oxidoreductase